MLELELAKAPSVVGLGLSARCIPGCRLVQEPNVFSKHSTSGSLATPCTAMMAKLSRNTTKAAPAGGSYGAVNHGGVALILVGLLCNCEKSLLAWTSNSPLSPSLTPTPQSWHSSAPAQSSLIQTWSALAALSSPFQTCLDSSRSASRSLRLQDMILSTV